DALELAARIDEQEALDLGGVMAVAPLDGDPSTAFGRLETVADRIRERYPWATMVSAGMSADLEAAVEGGATRLGIGTALLGDREAIVGEVPHMDLVACLWSSPGWVTHPPYKGRRVRYEGESAAVRRPRGRRMT